MSFEPIWVRWLARITLLSVSALLINGTANGQDMEPRSYSNAPVGLNFMVATYGRSVGNVVFDPSLSIEDVEATINSSALGYARTINFFGMSGKIAAAVPYAWGYATGLINGQYTRASRSGLSDPRFKLSVNFFGSPALTPREFVKYKEKTIIGASLTVSAPLGQYDPNQRVNLGTNRWGFRPEIGIARTQGKWNLEAYGGLALFTNNNRYLNDNTLSQAPIASIQGHVAYTFKPGLWVAFDTVFFGGGRTTVNGVTRNDLQKNVRYGATFSLPVRRMHSIKFLFSDGLYTRVGSNFRGLGVAYQFGW